MADFLLVHGSWHGAWCWERLVPRLESRGHRVLAIDLPAHGADSTDPADATLEGYAQRVREGAAELGGRPLAVGHSMGGLAISQAEADAPGSFGALVYVCAFVPLPGEDLMAMARLDPDSLVFDSVDVGETSIRLQPEKVRTLFYEECSEEDARWATERLRDDPLAPLVTAYAEPRPLDVPRAYVECTRDRALSLGRQRAMAERVPMARVATIETDHSPFLSRPDELAERLHGMAGLAG